MTDDDYVCKICSHKATGIHFGVKSCDECKWFYQRSIVKNESYSCFFNDKCLINKYSRNRCKACRFKKCQKEGMSINENDLERIRNQVIERAIQNNLNTIQQPAKANESDVDEDLKRKTAPNMSTAIHLSLKINADQESMSYMNTFNVQNILNRHSTFRTANIVAKTSINENFIIYISLLKNKAYQTYKINIKECEFIKNYERRMQSGDFIPADQYVENKTVRECFVATQADLLAWLNVYAKQLPGFDKFDSEDFTTIIDSSMSLLLAIQVSGYVKNDENYSLFKNLVFCKSRMRGLFGHMFTDLILQFHKDFNQLTLQENELALFYPFVLTSCNPNLVKDRLCILQLKAKYTRALIYQFELNKRSPTFYQNLSDVFTIVTKLESSKEKIKAK